MLLGVSALGLERLYDLLNTRQVLLLTEGDFEIRASTSSQTPRSRDLSDDAWELLERLDKGRDSGRDRGSWSVPERRSYDSAVQGCGLPTSGKGCLVFPRAGV